MSHTLPSNRTNPSATSLIAWAPTLAIALALLVQLAPSRAAACSCMAPPPPAESAQNSTAVFEGRVTRIDDPQGEPKVHFQVVRSFKGPSNESIEVRTANSSAACGYGFEEGKSYLVYASEESGALHTGLCSRTRLASEASEDITALGLGVTPFDPGAGSDQATPPSAPAAPEPKKGGCASCSIGARPLNEDPSTAERSLGALTLLVLGLTFRRASYRITSRRRSGSRS
jgi:hypothetical protein